MVLGKKMTMFLWVINLAKWVVFEGGVIKNLTVINLVGKMGLVLDEKQTGFQDLNGGKL